jgi:ankyrin repeat protein
MFKKILLFSLVFVIAVSSSKQLTAGIEEDYGDINRFLQWGDMEQFAPAVKKNKAAVNFNNGAIILDYANFMAEPSFLKILLDAGANPNAKQENTNNNALHILLSSCTPDNVQTVLAAVKMLVAKGIDVNHQESFNGYTPLHVAARNEYVTKEIFEALLAAKNIDVNIKCKQINEFEDGGWQPLFYLVKRVNDNQGTNKDIAKMLIAKKAEIKATTLDQSPVIKRKWNLLHICAETAGDHLDVFQVLLDSGAEMEAMTTNELFSPLHVAMLSDSPKITAYLLEKGADYMSKNVDGVTILDHSKGFGTDKHFQSADIIIKWAASHPK